MQACVCYMSAYVMSMFMYVCVVCMCMYIHVSTYQYYSRTTNCILNNKYLVLIIQTTLNGATFDYPLIDW